jgi:hypothetical protein
VDIEPRSTGEILDDACRLALADGPLLLVFSLLFQTPAFVVLLLLWAHPVPDGPGQLVLPVLAALLLPLTGLTSGAAQELFRRRADGQPATFLVCLGGALRHGLEHAAARALVLLAILIGLLLMVMPGLAIWSACCTVHALVTADKGHSGELLAELGREARFDPSKAATVTLVRLPLLLLAVINLHLLVVVALWIAGNFGGFDTALLELQASLGNPLYAIALLLLAWMLLTPVFEASAFLLHLDVRTRQEGLDLLFRVRRIFPTARLIGLLLALSFLCSSVGHAADARSALQQARQDLHTIHVQVENADPFPGGQRWQPRLRELSSRLERAVPGGPRRIRWLNEAVEDFGKLATQKETLRSLDSIDRRLGLLEDSLTRRRTDAEGRPLTSEEVKSRLRREPPPPQAGKNRQQTEPEEERPKRREKVRRDDSDPGQAGPGAGSRGAPAPAAGGGLGKGILWIILAGIAAAVLIAFVALWLSSRRRQPPQKQPAAAVGKTAPAAPPEPAPHEQSVSVLWQQADTLAREGRFLEGLRVLYRAILSLLHRQQLLRYEPTRTNGEYVEQVRRAPQAPEEVPETLRQLTDLFEVKWYGERACDRGDYDRGHQLAEEIRGQVEG